MINVRQLSVRCGVCNAYQTLSAFARNGDWNVYTYECENDTCDPAATRTFVEVPRELDGFARRDPQWRGGGRHGAHGDGTEGDGTEGDGAEDDGTEGDGAEDDGTEGDGAEDDGTEGDGAEDDGTEGDGAEGDPKSSEHG